MQRARPHTTRSWRRNRQRNSGGMWPANMSSVVNPVVNLPFLEVYTTHFWWYWG
jgi:hypothetical protein